MQLIKARGRLMAIGGGEDKENACLILKEFLRLAGGEQAIIAVLTTATNLPTEAAEKYKKILKK